MVARLPFRRLMLLLVPLTVCCSWVAGQQPPARVGNSLIALYEFDERAGPVIRDKSGVNPSVHLVISNLDAVERAERSLTIIGGNVAIRSAGPAGKLINAFKATNELTFEALVTPANVTQGGPARIISISRDAATRNFTLGQSQNQYIVRLRTSQTDANGVPEFRSPPGAAKAARQHIVVTFGAGKLGLYIDGQLVAEEARGGDLSTWDATQLLLLANEGTLDRPWQGRFEVLAVYNRALTAEEIQRNFVAAKAVRAVPPPAPAAPPLFRPADGAVTTVVASAAPKVHRTLSDKGCWIGTAGEYPMGWEGMLSRLGIPYERIWLHQNQDADVFKQYQVVFATCPSTTTPGFGPAFLDYVQHGGRGLVELWRYHRAELIPGNWVEGAGQANQQVVLEHPITKYFKLGQVIACGGRRYPFDTIVGLPADKAQVLLRYTVKDLGGAAGNMAEHEGNPACVLATVGSGELIHVGSRAGFVVGWDIEDPEPLVQGIIEYLCRGLATPRFVGTRESEWVPSSELGKAGESDAEAAPAGDTRTPPILPGYETARAPYSDAYNVTATLQPGRFTDTSRELVFDHQNTTTFSALEFGPDGFALVRVKAGKRFVAAQGRLPDIPTDGLRLLLVRRPDAVRLVLGGSTVARYTWANEPSGFVYYRPQERGGRLSDVRCQRVAEAVFSDDFTREADEQDTWEVISGTWKKTGIPESPQSINGFAFTGKATKSGLAKSGSWWWDRYTASVAVKPENNSTTVGLCVEIKDDGEYCLLKLPPKTPDSQIQLVWVRPEGEKLLASAKGGCVEDQWTRLAVRLTDQRIEGFVDGIQVVSATDPTDGLGAIGLYVSDGEATFDDADVQPSGSPNTPLPIYKGEGGPEPRLPQNVGPTDYMTWASRAVEWVGVPERPTLLWHRGVYFGDVALRQAIPAGTPNDGERALFLASSRNPASGLSLRMGQADGTGKRKVWVTQNGDMVRLIDATLPSSGQMIMEVARRGDKMVASWGGQPIVTLPAFRGPAWLAIEVIGPPIRVADVSVQTQNLMDYNFAAAPTDWWVGSGEWRVSYRWDCERRWSWYSGSSTEVASLWNKHRFEGDQVLDFYIGVTMEWQNEDETKRARDLNCVLCGDGKDVTTGYSFVLGGVGGRKTTISRNGQIVAESPDVGVPGGRAVHHQWHHIQVQKIGNRVALYMENRPVLEYQDPQPLSGGYMGIWTYHNAILVARVSIYYENRVVGQLLSLTG